MPKKTFDLPSVSAIEGLIFAGKFPEITNLSYDLTSLEIKLLFEWQSQLKITFKNVIGFRVLDEGNLLEFWISEVRVPGWLWDVQAGGWFDLEKERGGFVEGYHDYPERKEYLVIGMDDCVSILTTSEPDFLSLEIDE